MKKLLTVFTAALCLGACCAENEVEYNRGIGVYPGNPDEDFSPILKVDHSYRNIALHRAAYASSSHDYCLTGQLITDGIISEVAPKYFTMETSENQVIKIHKPVNTCGISTQGTVPVNWKELHSAYFPII